MGLEGDDEAGWLGGGEAAGCLKSVSPGALRVPEAGTARGEFFHLFLRVLLTASQV